MVIAEAKRRHGQEGQIVAGVGLQRMALADDDRTLLDRAHAQDADLGLHDDRRLETAARCAVVAQREGAVGQIVLRSARRRAPWLASH